MTMKELRYLGAGILLLVLISVLIYLSFIHIASTPPGVTTTTSSQIITKSKTQVSREVEGFLEVGKVYEDLGYPKIFWDPRSPNYTVHYHAAPIYYDLGYLKMPAIDLEEALEIALRVVNATPIGYFKMSVKAANITPQNYKLVSAYFSPGRVINGSLIIEPTWSLNFVRVFKGYWIWGGLGDYSNINVIVDAFRGVVRQVSRYEEDLPPSNATFNLRINSSQAVQILRSSNIPGIPDQLLRKGAVRLIDLRIARISPDAKNLLLQSPVDPKFINKYRLYWFIILSGENIRGENLTYPVGSFLVDAETGEVAAATYYTTLLGMKWQTVFTKLNYSSAENLSIENATITACPKFTREFPPPEDSLIKPVIKLSCFPLVVENVVVVKPGSSGKIYLQIKPINIDSDVILSFKAVDPLGNQDIPRSLISFPSNAVAKNGSTISVPITITAPQNARQKTYLIELDTYWKMPDWSHAMKTRAFFLLSVWDQSGEWPRPPSQLLTGLSPG